MTTKRRKKSTNNKKKTRTKKTNKTKKSTSQKKPETKTKKSTKKKIAEQKKQDLTDNQIRIRLLKTEIQYFKGLAIMVVVMTICVFLAFGVLFSAMYLEVRATRVSFEKIFSDMKSSHEKNIVTFEQFKDKKTVEEKKDTLEKKDWLFFEKYGVKVYFPNAMTYLDRPFKKELHFFVDGQVRESDSADQGDIYLSFASKDNYSNMNLENELIKVANVISTKYTGSMEEIILIPINGDYLEVHMDKTLDLELKNSFLKKLILTE